MFTVLTIFWDVDNYNTVYMDYIRPVLFSPSFPGGEFKTGRNRLQIWRAKITRGRNNPVYSFSMSLAQVNLTVT